MAALPLIVAAIFLLAILFLGLPLGKDFRGGTLVMVRGVEKVSNLDQVRAQLKDLTGLDAQVKVTADGFDIELDALNADWEDKVRDLLVGTFGIPSSAVKIGALGPAVGSSQVLQLVSLGVSALIVMGVVIFIFRRRVAATAAIIIAILDVIGILGLMALFRVDLDLAAIMGILITLGYVVDTNFLLGYRLLKGAVGEPRENLGEAMKAGLTMSAVAVAALLSMETILGAAPLKQLAWVLAFGVIVNAFNTWFLGAVLYLRHVEQKKVVSYHVSI
jgi:preprotein translocase subunit SecF